MGDHQRGIPLRSYSEIESHGGSPSARAGRVAPARAIEGQQETRRRVDEVVAPFWEVTWAKWPNSTSETGTAPSISIQSTMRQERNRLCAIELRRLDASTPIFFVKICLAGDGRAGVFPVLRRTLSPMPAITMQLPDSPMLKREPRAKEQDGVWPVRQQWRAELAAPATAANLAGAGFLAAMAARRRQ